MEQTNETTCRRRRSKQQIRELLTAFENSNLSVIDFCREHNISRPNFHKWKSRYKPVDKKISPAFTTLDIVSSPGVNIPGLFAEVNGIRIYQPVSASFLRELLA